MAHEAQERGTNRSSYTFGVPMRRTQRQRQSAHRAGARLCGILALTVAVAGCDVFDRLLQVEAPGFVDAGDVEVPENAHLLVSGATADFECALGAYIVNSGLLGNELQDASVTAARFSLDARTIEPSSPYGTNSCSGNPPGIYSPLATAIWSSNNAVSLLEGWTDTEVSNRTQLIGQAAAHSGYAHTLMGEGFCSSVIEPLGSEVSPAQIFTVAEARFDRAVQAAQAAGDDHTLNLATLGRARVRLNQGDAAGAAADARAVLDRDPAFEHFATASTAEARRWNRLGDEFFGGRATVAPFYRDLTVAGEPDPRVAVVNTETVGHDNTTLVWLASKVGTSRTAELRSRPVPVATWREAHLIIAEAEGGQTAVDHINALRAHHGLPAYAGGTEDEIRDQVIEERSRELFLEGHHLNDLRRFNLAQVPAVGAQYRQGGVYGDARCFPLPAVERAANPNVN
jgi:starch-binding outer membrane protein, SusD/RagB family